MSGTTQDLVEDPYRLEEVARNWVNGGQTRTVVSSEQRTLMSIAQWLEPGGNSLVAKSVPQG